MQNELLKVAGNLLTYTYQEMLINMTLSIILGLVLSSVYKLTHKGLSYSQSFTQTILFSSLIITMVMMIVGSSLARAFALVGALSIIRFRTVLKDTKDMSFVFASLALGMAAGTSNYFLALTGTVFICGLAFLLYKLNYGALYKSEFILRFIFDQAHNSAAYLEVMNKYSKKSNLLSIEPSGDGKILKLTYDITLKEDLLSENFVQEMDRIEGTSEIVLIASKSDVDY